MAIAKSTSGSGFVGAIGYALQTTKKKGPEELKPVVLAQNNCFGTASELAGQMRLVADGRQRIQKPVTHLVFALPPGEKVTPAKAMTALESILADIGVRKDNNQYIVVQHRDKAHDHYHVVLNRVGLDGSLVQDKFLNNRLQVAASKVEQTLDFAITPNRTFVYSPGQENGKNYIFQERLTPKFQAVLTDHNPVIEDDKQKLQRILNQVMPTVKDILGLQAALQLQGITTKTKEVKGNVVGISFKMPTDIQLKGSEVGFPMSKINTLLVENSLAKEAPLLAQGKDIPALDPVVPTQLVAEPVLPEQLVAEPITPEPVLPELVVAEPITPEQAERSRQIQEAINKLRPSPHTPEEDVRAERIRAAIDNIRTTSSLKQAISDNQPIGRGQENTSADLERLERNLRSDQAAAEKQRAIDAAERNAEEERRLAASKSEAGNRVVEPENLEPERNIEESRKQVKDTGPKRRR